MRENPPVGGEQGGERKDRRIRGQTPIGSSALDDILMCCFADKDKNHVMPNLDAIREALIVLMTEDQSFMDAIELSTS
jgi:hypothetical protein